MCHYCAEDGDATVLSPGDVVKVDLAAHIDGYLACSAHTALCPAADGTSPPAADKQADCVAAALLASELLPRLCRSGLKASAVPAALAVVAEAFGVSVVEGVLMHQVKRFVIDGNKVVAAKVDKELKAADFAFEPNEVFVLEACFSTGEGKTKVVDERQTAVYKRQLDKKYSLKVKASRSVFGAVADKFSVLPFSLRALQAACAERDSAAAAPGAPGSRVKLGLVECLKNELLTAFPVLYEKPGESVVHFKQTVLLMPNGPDPVTGPLAPMTAPPPAHGCEKKLADEALLAMLAEPLKANKKAAKKAAKAAAAAEGAEPMAE